MKKILISFIFFIIFFASTTTVHALTLNAPTITGVEYPDATSLKIKYNTNNTNSNYQILLYNMTSGELVKQAINTTSYTFQGLETGKVYNFKARIYYLENNKPQLSNWSSVISVSPKAGSVNITSVTGANGQLALNYTTTGTPTGVEIYVKELGKSYKTTDLKSYTLTGLTNGKTYTVTMRTYYANGSAGDWTPSKTITITSASVALGTLKPSNGQIIVNYTTSGSPAGVEISVYELDKTFKTTNLKTYTIKGLTNNKKYTIKIRAYYDNGSVGSWTTSKTATPTLEDASCTLSYNSVNDKLTFASTRNAKSFAISKKGNTASYKTSTVTYYPGKDRMYSKAMNVSITYIGYVKNSAGKVSQCKLTVSVSRGAAVAAYGKKFLGVKYCHWQKRKPKVWNGGSYLKCTDCSGFTAGLYRHFGKKGFSTDDDVQCRSSYKLTYKVSGKNSVKNAKVGDIVCYPGSGGYRHVAIYLGDKKILHNTTMGSPDNVKITAIKKNWAKIVRVVK